MQTAKDDNQEVVELHNFTLPLDVYQLRVGSVSTSCDIVDSKEEENHPSPIVSSIASPTSPTSMVSAQIEPTETDVHDYVQSTKTRIRCTTLQMEMEIHTHDLQYDRGNKWLQYLTNPIFCARLLTLFLLFLLLTLCIAYCVAQLLSVKLELVKKCNINPKSNQDIWRHSYEMAPTVNGEIAMNFESMYGLTDESCYTTNTYDANTDRLWFANHYTRQWTHLIDLKFILFVLLAIYCALIIVYNVSTVILDIYYIHHKRLHTQSVKYKKHVQQQRRTAPKIEKPITRTIHNAYRMYTKYMSTDTTGYIIRVILNEVMELSLQSQALMLYNGYNAFARDEDIYLANKPDYIVVFAVILALNSFGAAMLWFSYAWAHTRCHGLVFRLSILFIDQFCDLFYAIFPLITVFTDTYNQHSNDNLVLLGQVHIHSGLAFLSACFPLFLLCTKSLFIIHSAVLELRNGYYTEWKFIHDVMNEADDKDLASKALSTSNPIQMDTLSTNDQRLYDAEGNVLSTFKKRTSKKSWIDRNALRSGANRIKQSVLSVVALIYVIFGIVVLVLVQTHVENATSYCNSIREQNYIDSDGQFIQNITLSPQELLTLKVNPELFFWDKCLYKIYPFTPHDTQRCQCRVLVIDWADLDTSATQRVTFNLTQNKILSGMLEHWVMLEKFKTKDAESGFHELKFVFTHNMFKSLHMKAFEWNSAGIGSFESGISSWKALEYLKFEQTAGGLAALPSDLDGLSEVKYLSFISSGISSLPLSVCDLKQLQVLQLQRETQIQALPHCIDQLTDLQVLLIDFSITLVDIPLAMFALPHLVVLSLFKAHISYDGLLQYNAPIDLDLNDTDATHEWFNANFSYNTETEYYISLAPICDEDIASFPQILAEFINTTNVCEYLCEVEEVTDTFCNPMTVGDGRCDESCNIPSCGYDAGDCMQLCFAPEISNCSLDKLNNDKCDEGCNNKYCTGYEWMSTFDAPYTIRKDDGLSYAADLHQCVTNVTVDDSLIVDGNTCTRSARNSVFVDAPADKYKPCVSAWIGDGECDDSCRTEECSYDLDDCALGCVDGTCNLFYQFWLMFAGQDVYKMTHQDVCATIIPTAVQLFGIEDPENCSESVAEMDYNQDKYLNFREFASMAYAFSDSDPGKGAQINCSECIGMQYYNI